MVLANFYPMVAILTTKFFGDPPCGASAPLSEILAMGLPCLLGNCRCVRTTVERESECNRERMMTIHWRRAIGNRPYALTSPDFILEGKQ